MEAFAWCCVSINISFMARYTAHVLRRARDEKVLLSLTDTQTHTHALAIGVQSIGKFSFLTLVVVPLTEARSKEENGKKRKTDSIFQTQKCDSRCQCENWVKMVFLPSRLLWASRRRRAERRAKRTQNRRGWRVRGLEVCEMRILSSQMWLKHHQMYTNPPCVRDKKLSQYFSWLSFFWGC